MQIRSSLFLAAAATATAMSNYSFANEAAAEAALVRIMPLTDIDSLVRALERNTMLYMGDSDSYNDGDGDGSGKAPDAPAPYTETKKQSETACFSLMARFRCRTVDFWRRRTLIHAYRVKLRYEQSVIGVWPGPFYHPTKLWMSISPNSSVSSPGSTPGWETIGGMVTFQPTDDSSAGYYTYSGSSAFGFNRFGSQKPGKWSQLRVKISGAYTAADTAPRHDSILYNGGRGRFVSKLRSVALASETKPEAAAPPPSPSASSFVFRKHATDKRFACAAHAGQRCVVASRTYYLDISGVCEDSHWYHCWGAPKEVCRPDAAEDMVCHQMFAYDRESCRRSPRVPCSVRAPLFRSDGKTPFTLYTVWIEQVPGGGMVETSGSLNGTMVKEEA